MLYLLPFFVDQSDIWLLHYNITLLELYYKKITLCVRGYFKTLNAIQLGGNTVNLSDGMWKECKTLACKIWCLFFVSQTTDVPCTLCSFSFCELSKTFQSVSILSEGKKAFVHSCSSKLTWKQGRPWVRIMVVVTKVMLT